MPPTLRITWHLYKKKPPFGRQRNLLLIAPPLRSQAALAGSSVIIVVRRRSPPTAPRTRLFDASVALDNPRDPSLWPAIARRSIMAGE